MLLHHENGSMVIPGDRLVILRISTIERNTVTKPQQQQQPPAIQYVAGEGTYVRNDVIISSVVGQLKISSTTIPVLTSNQEHAVPPEEPQIVTTVSVVPKDGVFRAKQQVIRVGQTVLGRVARTQQQILVDIVANPYGVLDSMAIGMIRREDVTKILPSTSSSSGTATASPHTSLASNAVIPIPFRVGDWIAARVVSLGDDRYSLTTAESSLGVIFAVCSTSGQRMIPVSNRDMQCPITGIIEARKCARPPPAILSAILPVGPS